MWESKGIVRALGKSKTINDIDSYYREKFLYISANENVEFNVYMNTLTAKGEAGDVLHTIIYDAEKIAPVDLCGFTYEHELSSAEIAGTGIMIEEADLTNGVIVYCFSDEKGRNIGINNIIKFKSLTSVSDAEIKYTIQ